ncbi:MAG: hypothetical protein DSM106950_04360 [Stigonema ocellatum SAG 48.90 = DSM 106950]|nr:hypothetical protein [Stigonema ocellatum SAG 48.90 = DSM 106950]
MIPLPHISKSPLPTPHSRLPTPYSPLPTPHSLLPTPYSLLPSQKFTYSNNQIAEVL